MPDEKKNLAHMDREALLIMALSAIMELTEIERTAVLSNYAERYGWNIENRQAPSNCDTCC